MPNYDKMSLVVRDLAGRDIDRYAMRNERTATQDRLATVEELTDDHFMLASPNVHGFSLIDKEWSTSRHFDLLLAIRLIS